MTEKTFVKKLSVALEHDGFLVKNEVGVGYGVADLVLIKNSRVNIDKCEIRNGHKQYGQLLREDYFKVLSYLPDYKDGEVVDINYLSEKTNIPKRFLKYTLLKSLENKKFVKKVDGKYYCKVNGWLPIAKEVIAVEAKLRDWKRGIFQANRYKVFADQVYLAIPSSVQHLVDREMLSRYNVGLIVFDPATLQKRTAVRARTVPALNAQKKNYAIEYFWGRNLLRKLSLT